MQIRKAKATDLARIEELLRDNALPTAGVRDAMAGFLVAEDGKTTVAAIGVEPCGPRYGLLRSAVVSSEWRGKGIGRRLVDRAIAEARGRGVEALYLLTTTAENFFPRFGFTRTARDTVPEPVRASDEFRGACPESATVMTLAL